MRKFYMSAIVCLFLSQAANAQTSFKNFPPSFDWQSVLLELIAQSIFDRVLPADVTQNGGTVKSGHLQESAVLVVATEKGALVRSWREEETKFSKIKGVVDVPCDIQYVVDLNCIKRTDCEFDSKKKTLTVRIPNVTVGLIEPKLDEVKRSKETTGTGKICWIGAGRLQNAALGDAMTRAREYGAGRVTEIAELHARQKVKEQIQKFLVAIDHAEIEVVVR